jgi:hypothetical protein
VFEELVELLEHLDAWFVDIFELFLLRVRNLGKFVVDIFEKICQTASLCFKRLVFADAITAFRTVSPASFGEDVNDAQFLYTRPAISHILIMSPTPIPMAIVGA